MKTLEIVKTANDGSMKGTLLSGAKLRIHNSAIDIFKYLEIDRAA